jgi:hypothetical protein
MWFENPLGDECIQISPCLLTYAATAVQSRAQRPFHESVMRFKADIGQAFSQIWIYEYTPRPSGWADVE